MVALQFLRQGPAPIQFGGSGVIRPLNRDDRGYNSYSAVPSAFAGTKFRLFSGSARTMSRADLPATAARRSNARAEIWQARSQSVRTMATTRHRRMPGETDLRTPEYQHRWLLRCIALHRSRAGQELRRVQAHHHRTWTRTDHTPSAKHQTRLRPRSSRPTAYKQLARCRKERPSTTLRI